MNFCVFKLTYFSWFIFVFRSVFRRYSCQFRADFILWHCKLKFWLRRDSSWFWFGFSVYFSHWLRFRLTFWFLLCFRVAFRLAFFGVSKCLPQKNLIYILICSYMIHTEWDSKYKNERDQHHSKQTPQPWGHR